MKNDQIKQSNRWKVVYLDDLERLRHVCLEASSAAAALSLFEAITVGFTVIEVTLDG